MELRAKYEYTVPRSPPMGNCCQNLHNFPQDHDSIGSHFPNNAAEEKVRENSLLRLIPHGVLTTVGFSISTGYSDDKLMSLHPPAAPLHLNRRRAEHTRISLLCCLGNVPLLGTEIKYNKIWLRDVYLSKV